MRIVTNFCSLTLIFKNYDILFYLLINIISVTLFLFPCVYCFNSQPDSTATERAIARLAMHPLLKKKIDVLKGTNK